jgi:hypothetical protein
MLERSELYAVQCVIAVFCSVHAVATARQGSMSRMLEQPRRQVAA